MVNINRPARGVITEMRKRKVSVSSRRQDEFKNWIRISAGTDYETEVFLKTLKDVLSKAS
jgi:histidinol-phosphate/aromatic aminotransferase/cobyric acid decarboxylase-like protein